MAPARETSQVSSTDRIQQLNEIDRNLVKLLDSAGAAVTALTCSSTENGGPPDKERSLQDRKEAFSEATSQYFALLASIDVNLRRQIMALEDADIIAGEATTRESQSGQYGSGGLAAPAVTAALSKQGSTSKGTVTGGGLGNLDVGWLNSRNDRVGKEKEATLWQEAVRLTERALESKDLQPFGTHAEDDQQNSSTISGVSQHSNGDAKMEDT